MLSQTSRHIPIPLIPLWPPQLLSLSPAFSASHLMVMEEPKLNHEFKEKGLMPKHNKAEPSHEVRLAALAITFNVRLRSSDMPLHMQEHSLRYTRSLVGDPASSSPKSQHNPTHLARALKKEFDSVYGPAWHCVIGRSFGSFVTHTAGGFIYFSIDSLSVLLFKTEVHLVTQPPTLS